ncbi:MAG: hypothetical protein ACREJO_13575 [Phycisphaerales bacterium]
MSAVPLTRPIAPTATLPSATLPLTMQTVPTGELFWAVLDPAALGTVPERQVRQMVALRSPALTELFGRNLPLSVDAVHAVYALQRDGRVLACGIALDRLDELNGADLLVLCPDQLPEPFLAIGNGGADIDPRSLNFLVDEHEPRPVQTARKRIGFLACGMAVVVAIVALVGIERRAADVRRERQAVLEATAGVLRQVVGRAFDPDEGVALVESELARLHQTRMKPASADRDAAQGLASLLSGWPRGEGAPHVRTETLTVASDTITLNVLADDRAAAGKIADALRTIHGWTLMEPQMSAADDKTGSVRLQLRLVREEPAGTAEVQP